MASIARSSSISVARLAASFRHAVTLTSPRQTALSSSHAGPSARTFRTSTSTAFASSSSSSSTPSESSANVETGGEAEVKKPKRKRRSKDEIEAAKLAKLALGISGRHRKRTRTALGTAAAAKVATKDKAPQANPEPKRRGRPKLKHDGLAAEAEVEDRNESDAGAVEEVLNREDMEKLLTQMEYAHLPPRNEWKTAFPNAKQHLTSYRYFMSNRATIRDIIPCLGTQDPERNGEKVTIVEGYPGPGTFASEFLQLPEVEKVIGLEETPRYLQKLEVLRSQLEDKQPSGGQRLDMLKSSAYTWDTYTQLVSSGKLGHLNNRVSNSDGSMVDFTTNDFIPPDHTDASWQKLSPMIFFAQLPNTVYGEQLFAQIIAAISSRIWLFRHGRIQLGFICGESLARRCLAEAGDKMTRGKLGTTVQCLADVQVHKYAHELQPHSHHFFPSTMSVGPRVTVSGTSLIPNSNPSTGLTRMGMVMMTVTPKKKPLVKAGEIEAFEYITRNLFILRTKPLGEALTHVAPGGQNVLKMTSEQQVEKGLIQPEEVILPHEIVGDLTNVQWACLARMFEKWPFRPRHLFEEGRVKVDNKGRN